MIKEVRKYYTLRERLNMCAAEVLICTAPSIALYLGLELTNPSNNLQDRMIKMVIATGIGCLFLKRKSDFGTKWGWYTAKKMRLVRERETEFDKIVNEPWMKENKKFFMDIEEKRINNYFNSKNT